MIKSENCQGDQRALFQITNGLTGIEGTDLRWIESYLSDRLQVVSVLGESSIPAKVPYGVPQGLQYHFYADDTQLYTSLSPTTTGDSSKMLESLANCLTDIQNWMSANFLQFNPDKTKFLVISSPQLKNKIHIQDLQVDDAIVPPSSDARNLGVSFDQFMTLEKHVSNTC